MFLMNKDLAAPCWVYHRIPANVISIGFLFVWHLSMSSCISAFVVLMDKSVTDLMAGSISDRLAVNNGYNNRTYRLPYITLLEIEYKHGENKHKMIRGIAGTEVVLLTPRW